MKAKSIAIFVVFFGLLLYKTANAASPQRIILDPEKFTPGTKVKVNFDFRPKSGAIQSVTIIGGVDEKTFFRRSYNKIDISKFNIPSFFWTATKGKHKIWFQIKRHSLGKSQILEKEINVQNLLKPQKTKPGQSSFVLRTAHKKKLTEIAKMIVRMESEKKISNTVAQYLKYISETEGAEYKADMSGLHYMKRQVEKEVWDSQREKDKKMLESQRKHIEKMLKMVEEMMNIQCKKELPSSGQN
jgi:hypothetical protein